MIARTIGIDARAVTTTEIRRFRWLTTVVLRGPLSSDHYRSR